MDFSILYALQHLHNAVLDRVMVGITSLGNAGWIWIALTAVFLILPKYRKCGVRTVSYTHLTLPTILLV